jgi:hypothetical protein
MRRKNLFQSAGLEEVFFGVRKMKSLLIMILIFGLQSFCWAASGNSSAAFLRIDVGARPAGLGGAFTAIADDSAGVHFNPAGLAFVEHNELSATHNNWLGEIGGESITLLKQTQLGVLGLNLVGLYIADIKETSDKYEEAFNTKESFSALDGAFTLSFAQKLKETLSCGLNFKGIYQSIKEESGLGVAFDFGTLYRLREFAFGIAVQNVGSKLKIYKKAFPLPITLRGGISYKVGKLLLAMDVSKPLKGSTCIHGGAEYKITQTLEARVGYRKGKERISGATFGLTLCVKNYRVDYGYIAGDENLGSAHQLSLIIKL